MDNPNPMNSRCGLEDCDCGHMIEKLVKALEKITERMGKYSRDPLQFACNTIDGMDGIAREAIKSAKA